MVFLEPSYPSNKVHDEKKNGIDDSDDQNSRVAKFCARHLKRKFCEAYCFDKREVFRTPANSVADAEDRIYKWPENQIHSMARDTHAALNLRFPVPDDKVVWSFEWGTREQSQCDYQPNFATAKDELDYSDSPNKNPGGRLSCHTFFIFLYSI